MLSQFGVSTSSSFYWIVAGGSLAARAALAGFLGLMVWLWFRAKIISVDLITAFLGFVFGVWLNARLFGL